VANSLDLPPPSGHLLSKIYIGQGHWCPGIYDVYY